MYDSNRSPTRSYRVKIKCFIIISLSEKVIVEILK